MSDENTEIKTEENNQQGNLGVELQGFSDLMLNCRAILGKIKMPVSQFLKLSRGSIIELNRKKTDFIDVTINGAKVAEGEIMIQNDNVSIEIGKSYKKPKV